MYSNAPGLYLGTSTVAIFSVHLQFVVLAPSQNSLQGKKCSQPVIIDKEVM
jgi:hypothetical protein